MSSEPAGTTMAIRAERVGKFYPGLTPRGMLRYLWPAPLQPRPDDFWALREVSVEVPRGRVLGLIGQNGCGKSTLLKMIAGLLAPSEGRLEVDGKVAALLELGAGFDPEFTGRENVLLSGAIYGYSRAEMAERFDEIVAFADIGPHLDHPVKTYSSGMFARLAFAVAIQVNPQVLLVDEILSVGDVGFQARCFQRIEALRAAGTTIVFVSHDMGAVQMLCDDVLLLHHGRIIERGPPRQVTDSYFRLLTGGATATGQVRPEPTAAQARARCGDLRITDPQGRPADTLRAGELYVARCRVEFPEAVAQPVISLQLKTMMGFVAYDVNTLLARQPVAAVPAGGRREVAVGFRLNVCAGPYRLGLGIAGVEGDLPRPLGGVAVAFDVMSGQPGFGVANLEAEFRCAEAES